MSFEGQVRREKRQHLGFQVLVDAIGVIAGIDFCRVGDAFGVGASPPACGADLMLT
jgi:hypothetical protein